MKNKFTKIILLFIVACILACNLLIVPVSAVDDDDSIIGTWVFNDSLTTLNGTFYINFGDGESYEGYTSIIITPGLLSPIDNIRYSGSFGYVTAYSGNQWNGIDYKTITITGGDDITNQTFITWLKANATKQGDDSGGGDTPGGDDTTCLTLEELLQDYTGSFSSIVEMLNTTNYQEYLDSFPTLPELLHDYTGSFDSIVDMLNSTNYDEYSDYIDYVKDSAYNDGASSNFGESVLGSAFQMPLDALNQWVLFETSTGDDVTMGGVITAVISLSLLIILLKMFSGG